MTFAVVGLNHTTASLAIRERFAISEDQIEVIAQDIVQNTNDEAIVLSTCNRVEFYVTGEDLDAVTNRAKTKLSAIGQATSDILTKHCYIKIGDEAILHLFKVAASLDSMVVGEPQILGQLKSAVQVARQAKTLGSKLNHLSSRAFATAKKVRHETGIGRNSISISSVAIDLARQVFGDFRDRKVLLIGAGKMAELAAAQFKDTGARLVVANRGRARADKIAARVGAQSRSLDDLNELIEYSDVVIASTGSRGYIFDEKAMISIMKKRKYRPIFFIDIAVPRNLDPNLNRIDGVYLYDLDALSSIAQDNVRKRQAEADAAADLVRAGVSQFKKDSQTDAVKPAIIAVRKTVLEMTGAEVDHIMQKLRVDPEQKSILDRLATNIANKVLHGAIEELKRQAGSTNETERTQSIMNVFQAGDKVDE
jgi:glutamyl-tRNA reductase